MTGSRILVVDDDELVRELLILELRRQGAMVAAAPNARVALSRLERERFDLVISDIEMPGRSGVWLLEEARARWAGLPVLLITGGVPERFGADRLAQASAVLQKPFGRAELLGRIREALATAGTG